MLGQVKIRMPQHQIDYIAERMNEWKDERIKEGRQGKGIMIGRKFIGWNQPKEKKERSVRIPGEGCYHPEA